MKKITIYTLADKRPDFIPVQDETLKKFVKDEYEYVVFNNAIDSKRRREEISRICKERNIKCVEVKKNPRLNLIGGQKAISWLGSYNNPNLACAYPIKWAWEKMCDDNKDKIFIIIDSDMFLCRPLSFNEELYDHDAAVMLQYRGPTQNRENAAVTYVWNGICVFDTDKIENIKKMNWDCGVVKKSFINGYPVDVGGYIHFWLKENDIKIRHLSEYAIYNFKQKTDNIFWLEAVINGNFHYSFEYDIKQRETFNFLSHEEGWKTGDKVLPHLPEGFEEILKNKTIQCFEKYILDKQTYPAPTFLGLIGFETFNEEIEPFIIHNKAGSGYTGLDDSYNRSKLEFIKKTLKLEVPTNINIKNDTTDFDFIFKSDIKVIIRMILLKIKKLRRLGQ